MLLDDIKKRKHNRFKERLIFITPGKIIGLIAITTMVWLFVKGAQVDKENNTYTKVEHVTYIKPYKYETIKKSWVDAEGWIIKKHLLKVYKQDGMKNDIPQWKYVKTVDYGEKKPNV